MSHHCAMRCRQIGKQFGRGDASFTVLRDVTFSLARGECCALLGPSGSGKTTLLSIMGCLLAPSHGEVLLEGQRIDFDRQDMLTKLRRNRIGYVFQQAQLMPFLSVWENLHVVGRNAGIASAKLCSRIEELAHALGIESRLGHNSEYLSGGERQRVAVARALLHAPSILLADEPTGALDAEQGRHVARLLTDQARQRDAALVVVTHDERIMDLFDRVAYIESGSIVT